MTDTNVLTIDDIADVRAYERERSEFLRYVIALKARRRVSVGPMVTVVFENRDTVRFQIQEMARVEKLISDEAIQTELDIYNMLIPAPGELCATMFVELTSEFALREWLPRLVGIERAAALQLADGSEIRSAPEDHHADQLTDDTTTASVHYIRYAFTPAQVNAFRAGPVTLRVDHPNYTEHTVLRPETVAELRGDLRGSSSRPALQGS